MMNTLHKSLIIATLIISTFISGINVDLVVAQNISADPAASWRPADMVSNPYLRFVHLTEEGGLSSNAVWGVAQNDRGFMWFANSL